MSAVVLKPFCLLFNQPRLGRAGHASMLAIVIVIAKARPSTRAYAGAGATARCDGEEGCGCCCCSGREFEREIESESEFVSCCTVRWVRLQFDCDCEKLKRGSRVARDALDFKLDAYVSMRLN